MDTGDGARLARLLLETFEAMVAEVVAELEQRGHPGLTAANEFALQAIDAGATSAAELARTLGVSRQAAAKTIATLEGLGYIVRDDDAADGRRKGLYVTDDGRQAVAVGSAAFDRLRKRWIRTVGAQQARDVERTLGVLRDSLG